MRLEIMVALILVAAAGGSRSESGTVSRSQLERDQAARQLELKLEQWQLAIRARSPSSTGRTGSRANLPSGGTRLPLAPIGRERDAGTGSDELAERRQLKTLFDRERFEQRELQLNQQRRAIASRSSRASTVGAGGGTDSYQGRLRGELQRFRMEQQQQLQRFRMRR